MSIVLGPFAEVVTLENLPLHGPIRDEKLVIRRGVGIEVADGKIANIAPMHELQGSAVELPEQAVAVPGLIDAHTHLCFAGTRSRDYALRLAGASYQQIAAKGGGILDTVQQTRAVSEADLKALTLLRLHQKAAQGVTTCEVKSGYGLSVESELKMLRVIRSVAAEQGIDLISTCLAAHTRPPEFAASQDYLRYLLTDLLPLVKAERLAARVDIFVDESAFSVSEARLYLLSAKAMGFSLTLHADQFSPGAARLAAEVGALSADHLECTRHEEYEALRKADVSAVVLPGATLGLGMPFAPARAMLDHGLSVAIASDWNPGSAPMGDLLTQGALLGAAQRLSMAETWAGLAFRAAKALGLNDRGVLVVGSRADIAVFPCNDYREILYHQGRMRPCAAFSRGRRIDVH